MHEPALYAIANDMQRQHVSDIADEFEDEIGEMSGRCIDVGSGPGDTAVDIILPKLKTEVRLVCSDVSEKMVSFGKEKYKDDERLSFVKLDIESPNLPEYLVEQFDHVLSFYCLHWCQDMRQAFENIFNLLRPGGTTFLVFIANFPGLNAYKELAAMPSYHPYIKDADRHIPVFQRLDRPRQNMKALIKDVGFEVRQCSVREKTYTFESLDSLSKFALAIDPFVDRMPAKLVEKYKRDLARGFAGHNIILTENSKGKDEHSVLCVYSTFVVCLRKPAIE